MMVALLLAGIIAAVAYYLHRSNLADMSAVPVSGVAPLDTQIQENNKQLATFTQLATTTPNLNARQVYDLSAVIRAKTETKNILQFNKDRGFAPTTVNQAILNAEPTAKDPAPPGQFWDYSKNPPGWSPLLA